MSCSTNLKCSEEDLDHGTECLQLALRYAGVKARLIPGPSDLWKVTYPKDIYTAIGCLKEKTSRVCIIAAEENDSTRLLAESLSGKVARVTFITHIVKDTFNIFVVFHVKEIAQEFDLTTLPVMDVAKLGLIVHVVQQTSVEMMKNTTVYDVNVSTRNLAQKYNQFCKSVVTIYCHTQDEKSLVELVTSLVLSDYKTFSGQTLYV